MDSTNVGTMYPSGRTTRKGARGAAAFQGLNQALNGVIGRQNDMANSGEYGGYENRGPGVTADDPLGQGVQARGVEVQRQERASRDPNYMSGPLIDPQWAGLFQAMSERGVDRIRGGGAVPVAASPDFPTTPRESNQFIGTSVQPDFFTGGDTFGGRTTARGRVKKPGPWGLG